MREASNSGWPFEEVSSEGFDMDAIFGGKKSSEKDPFEDAVAEGVEENAELAADGTITEQPAAPEPGEQKPAVQRTRQAAEKKEEKELNPIEAAYQKTAAENAQQGLFEKPPVFCYRTAKEPIQDADMTFEELRIRKSEDFTDLEEGKYVSWSVEYCGIRKDVKDPKGTKISAMKETIERSKEFMEALKKSKDKNPDCLIRPKIVGKTKGIAAPYKGYFRTMEEAEASDKVICLIPAQDGQIYEMNKLEQGVFIAPKCKVVDFQEIRAGFTPALPLIPMSLMREIISFFRSFMHENGELEALALIYWDKVEKRFFAYVPKQMVGKDEVDADLSECPYDDEKRYIHYADIHSHNSMDAFFSGKDDRDERGTGLYFVVGRLDAFYPDILARICCGGSFVTIDPGVVLEGFDTDFPAEWSERVVRKRESRYFRTQKEDTGKSDLGEALLRLKREAMLF